MTTPGPPSDRPARLRLGVLLLAVGVAIAIAAVVAAIAVSGGDDAQAGSAADETTSDATGDVGPSEPAPQSAGRADVEFRRVVKVTPSSDACPATEPRPSKGVWCAADSAEAYRLGPAELRTSDVVDATAELSEQTGDAIVTLTLTEDGGERFEALTRQMLAEAGSTAPQIAIVVDDEVITAPTVQQPIAGGEIQISADFTQQEAESLATSIAP